jgi:signal transduction histidine kinase
MSIRLQLAATYAAGVVLTLSIVGIFIWSLMGAALRGSLETTLQTRADGVLAYLENAGQAGLQEQTGLQETDREAPGVFVALFSKAGSLLDATTNTPEGVRPSSGTVRIGGDDYLTLTRAAPDGTMVLTGADLRSVGDTLAALAQVSIGVGLLACVASLFGGWLLAGRALRPIGQLVDDASTIGPGDLDRRLSPPRRMDEIGRLTLTLNDMLDRIADSVGKQRLFVAMASHELRAPLAALRAELDDVDREDAGVRELRDALHEAQVDALRLSGLATSLIELAVAPEDARAVARSSVDLHELTSTVSRGLAPLARQRGVVIKLDVPGATVWVDRTRVEQALGNLVSNAITHGGRGGIVEVRGRVDGPQDRRTLEFEVLDRGPGIGDEPPEALFEPFRRGADAHSAGSGLGLATVAATVKAHRGQFGAANRDGGGARFWFAVPASR